MSRRHTIDVCVRVRPNLGSSKAQAVTVDTKRGRICVNRSVTFKYPTAVVQGSDQQVAFTAITTNLLARLHEGYSVTLLAYGQTGSGKTYTMFGPTGSLSEASLVEAGTTAENENVPKMWGIMPRAIMHLQRLSGMGTMFASAIEVYGSHAYDLLAHRKSLKIGSSPLDLVAPKAGTRTTVAKNSGGNNYARSREAWLAKQKARAEFKAKLAARTAKSAKATTSASKKPTSDVNKTFATVGETIVQLKSARDVVRLAQQVEVSRVAHGHALNERSSRSHCLVRVYVMVRGKSGAMTKRQMLFVDLAGSERIAKSKVEGMREKEAVGINQSLSVLGRVIKGLAAGDKHVPYRDSTLTKLLKSSFAGRSCTSVVVNVAGEPEHTEETVSSLRFGQRMTHVSSTTTAATYSTPDKTPTQLLKSLSDARHELKRMADAGMGARYDGVASEVKSFQRNQRLFEELTRKLNRVKQQLIEAKASGAAAESSALSARVSDLSFQVENIRMILVRQKSIKGFYREPTKAYLAKEREIKMLEGEARLMDINISNLPTV